MNDSVAIILVNWNGLQHTLKCISSLRQVVYNPFQIILVDNGSEESEVALLRREKDIHLIENRINVGFTGGNNIGIKYAYEKGFDFIMLLNNDTTVEPNFIEPLLSNLNQQYVGAAQPKICVMNEPSKIWSAGGIFKKAFGHPVTRRNSRKKYDKSKDIDWITGCCLIFHSSLVETVGYLDSIFFILCEDVDWSLRARKAGYKLRYVPQSKIYHFMSASAILEKKNKEGALSPFRQYLNIRNHVIIVRKYSPLFYRPLAFLFQLTKILTHLCYFFLRGRWGKFKSTLKGTRDGLGPFREIEF